MSIKKTTLVVSAFVVVCLAIALTVGMFAVKGTGNDSGNAVDGLQTLATVSAPLEDGKVSQQYTSANKPSDYTAVGGDSGRDFSYIRSNPTGKYILIGDLDVTTLDYGTTFSGILDGNGYKININAAQNSSNTEGGGMFAYLTGTVKNLTVNVQKFSAGGNNCNMEVGVMFAHLKGGTVDNVRLELNHTPTSATNGASDFYMHQSGQRYSTFSDVYLLFGGVAGKSFGGTISNFTLANNAGTQFGFGVNGWRDKGGLWDMKHFFGGLIGEVNGGDTNITNIKIEGSGNFINYNESSSSSPNEMFTGLLVGYCNENTTTIDGVIVNYQGNITLTNAVTASTGVLVGQADSVNLGSVKNIYYNVNSPVRNKYWVIGNNEGYNNIIDFESSLDPEFDGENIWFYGANSDSPDSANLTYQIQNGSQIQVVADQLILKDGESAGPVWIKVAKAGDAAGVDGAVNLNYSKVQQGTYSIATDMTPTGSDDNYNVFTKVYDGNLITAPTIQLVNSSDTVTISNVYTEANPDRNVGEHILTYNPEAVVNANYAAYTYNGKTVIGNPVKGIMYAPSAVMIDSSSTTLDISKDIKVNITPLPIEVGFDKVNFITYGDSIDAVKANNPDVVIVSVNGVKGAAAPDAISDWDIAGYVPYAQNAGERVPLSVQNVQMTNGSTANYSITSLYTEIVVAARQLKGNISLADGVSLVYDGTAKTAKFDILSGNEDDPEIEGRITFEYTGDNTNVGTFSVRAILPTVDGRANYSFSADSVTSAQYTITAMPLSVTAKEAQSKSYDGQVFSDFASLFNIPQGAGGEAVDYDFAVTKDGAPVEQILEAGVYQITATLNAGETNYTSDSASVQFTVTKAQISGSIEMPADMTYDGTEKIPTYKFDEGSSLFNEGEEIAFSYSGSNVNAGTVTVTASLPSDNYEFVIDGSASATQTAQMTIEKRIVNLSVENIVKEYDGTIYDFSGVEVSGKENFVDSVEVSVTSPSASANAGSYALVITTSLDSDSNYTINKDSDKTLTINPKSVNLTVADATKVYDGELYDFSGYTVNGMDAFLEADNVTASVSASDAKADKGVYKLNITTTADDNANYAITRSEDKILTITAREVTVSIENAVKTYDGLPYDFTDYAVEIGGDGFIDKDAVEISVSADGNATDKGVYPLIVTTTADSNPNYSITRSEDKTLTVNALEVSITAKEAQSKVYDGQAFTNFESLFNIPLGVGVESAQPLNYVFRVTKGEQPAGSVTDTGVYTVTATLADGQDNYISDTASVEFTVNALEVTIKTTQSQTTGMYDGEVVNETELSRYFEIPDGVDGNPLAVEISISGKDTQILNAGEYTVTMSLADTSGNYTASPASLTYILIKQTVNAPTPEAQTFTYNGGQFTYVIATNPRYTISGNTATDAGEYTATVTLKDTDNYQWNDATVSPKEYKWSVSKANSKVTPVIGGGEYFDGHAMPSIVTTEGDTAGSIVWVEDVLVFGTDTYNWEFTPEDTKNYKSATGTVTIKVKQIALASISATYANDSQAIYTSTPLDSLKAYITVKGINNDGSDYGVISQEEFSLSGTLTAGTSSITVSYKTFTANVEITGVIDVVLERLEMTSAPHKLTYTVFETLDTTGMVITAFYTDGSSKVVTSEVSASVSQMTVDTDKVTFTYTDGTGSKSVDVDVTVNKIKVAVPDVDEAQHFVYNSQVQTFEVPSGEQYNVSGNSGTDANDYTAVISLKDKTNYEWSTGGAEDISYPWAIEKMTLKGEIEMPENLVFDGKEKIAQFNLTVGRLYGDDSITVTYSGDRINVGTVDVSAQLPSSNYQFDEASVTTAQMVITPYVLEISFNNLTVVYNTPTEEFDINSIIASVKGVSGAQIQIGDDMYDYTVTVDYADESDTYQYGDPKDTTYALKVTVTIEGLSEQNYTYDKGATLKVIATPLEGVLVADSNNIEYDGLAHGARLTETTASEDDYEIQYSLKGKNSWSTEVPVNAGTYTVRVVSITDSYSGDRIATIDIVILKKNVSIEVNQSEVSKTYKGEVSSEELKTYFTAPAGVQSEGSLALAIAVTGVGEKVNGVGVYTVTAKLDASVTNYTASAVSFKYTVVAAEVTAPVPGVQSFVYNTQEQTFAIAADAKYSVSGNKATDAGNYTATVKLVDKKNYVWADTKTTADKTFSWSISKADPTVNPKVEGDVFYDGHAMPVITTSAGDTAGNILWTVDKLQIGVSEYGWKFNPTDSKNYNSVTGNYNLTVTAIALKSITVEVKPGVYVYTSATLDSIKEALIVKGTNNDSSVVENIPTDLIRLEGNIAAGAQIFKAYYVEDESITFEFAITITLVELASMTVSFEQGDLEIYPNSELDILRDRLTVTGINNDGSEYGVITEYSLSGEFNKSNSVITVHYTGSATSLTVEDVTFNVKVSTAALDRIEITQAPSKLHYTAYDRFNRAGMIITAYYTDGTSNVVEDYVVPEGEKMEVRHTETGIEVSYTEDEVTKTAILEGLTVTKRKVDLTEPTSQTFVYNGNPQTYAYAPGMYYSIEGNVQTNAGNYIAYVILNDKENCEWSAEGVGTTDFAIEWSIEKRDVIIVLDPHHDTEKVYDGETIDADYFSKFFSISAKIGEGESFTIEDIKIKVSVDSKDNKIVNAGRYTISATLADETAINFNANTIRYNYTVEKAEKAMVADVNVGYKTLTLEFANGSEDAYYSFDNKNWQAVSSLTLNVEMSDKYTIYLKYNEGTNYLASKSVTVEKNITKAALYSYIQETFDDTFGKEDIAAFEQFKTYAKSPDGESEEYDKAYAELLAQYNEVAGELIGAISSALSTGSKAAGYTAKAVAAAGLTFSTVGTGFALAALCVNARRKDNKKDGKAKRAVVAGLLVAVMIIGAVFALVGCEKAEVDNMGKVLDIVKTYNNLKVEIAEGEENIYVYDNGAITANKYNMLLNVNELIGTKGTENISFTKDNFVNGYSVIVDESTGTATVKGKLQNTGVDTLNNASVEIICNLTSKTASKYTITYTDAWGYNVTINLV